MRVPLGIAEVLEQKDIPRNRLFAAASFDTAQLASSGISVPRSDVYRVCEKAVALSGDPALGLHCIDRLSVSTFNPLSHLIRHATNLRQCLESLCTFHRLICEDSTFQMFSQGGKVVVRHEGPPTGSPDARRFWSELCMTAVLRIITDVSPHASLERVSFAHAAPEYADEYARVFERSVQFDEPFTELVLSQGLMEAVAPHRDPDVHSALRAIAERRILDESLRMPYAVRVRESLVQRGPSGAKDMNTIARSLGLSARSLRRRLTEEGKPYHVILNEALAVIANQYLRERRLSIQEVAYEMGFLDASTFHRAFKRWTGTTPSTVRTAAGRMTA